MVARYTIDIETGEQRFDELTPEEVAVLEALQAEAEAILSAPVKNDILLSLLDGLEPGDEATEVMLLVFQELLRP